MNIILDACAVIAYLRDETGAEQVENYLNEPQYTCWIHVINLCEVYYDFLRSSTQTEADAILNDLINIGLIFRDDIDTAFWQAVGNYKATIRRISLADCFALALTKRIDGVLLTSDHKEFDPIVTLNICPIRFIR